jgi:hypothetical protein
MAGPYTLKALPQTPQVIKDDGIQETPGPVRARLAMMDKQMDQLHKEKSLLEVSCVGSRRGVPSRWQYGAFWMNVDRHSTSCVF